MPNMTSDAPMIEARDIRKAFGANQVLRGVSLQLRQGEVVAVIGPSGSGKSTFLRCLNHLETIDSGHIAIEGETLVTTDAQGRCVYAPDAELRRICRKTGMVFQHFNLFGHLTVLENLIEAPMVVQGLSREAAIARAERLPITVPVLRVLEACRGERTDGPLILRPNSGNPVDRRDVYRMVARIAKAAAIPRHISPHSLRHAAITNALDAGVPLRDAQILARHADPRTTEHYDRARGNLDRHGVHFLTAYVAGV